MPHISELEEQSRANLERILAVTDLRALTVEDVKFLKARRDYLNGEQLAVYGKILAGADPEAEAGPPQEPIAKPTKAPRRRGPRKTGQ